MITYRYCNEEETVFVEMEFPSGKAPDTIEHEGQTLNRDFMARRHERNHKNCWPVLSRGLGVGIHQVKEAEKHYHDIGIPTDFDKQTGEAVLRDNDHRNKVMAYNGIRDNDACYNQYSGD